MISAMMEIGNLRKRKNRKGKAIINTETKLLFMRFATIAIRLKLMIRIAEKSRANVRPDM